MATDTLSPPQSVIDVLRGDRSSRPAVDTASAAGLRAELEDGIFNVLGSVAPASPVVIRSSSLRRAPEATELGQPVLAAKARRREERAALLARKDGQNVGRRKARVDLDDSRANQRGGIAHDEVLELVRHPHCHGAPLAQAEAIKQAECVGIDLPLQGRNMRGVGIARGERDTVAQRSDRASRPRTRARTSKAPTVKRSSWPKATMWSLVGVSKSRMLR